MRRITFILSLGLLLAACQVGIIKHKEVGSPPVDTPTPHPTGVPLTTTPTASHGASPLPTPIPLTPTPTPHLIDVPLTATPTANDTGASLPTAVPLTPTPAANPTAPPVLGTLSDLEPPLVVDSEAGRLYVSARVDGAQKIVALAATDGQLLVAYDASGPFAVDGARGRLYVDRDDTGLLVLDTETGAQRAVVSLPANTNEVRAENPAPQADPATGRVLAFRDNVVYVIDHIVDPQQGTVVDTIAFDIPKGNDCRNPMGPLPINWTAYDDARRILYLDFTTYVCTPWVSDSLVSYDMATGAEIARDGVETSPAAIAANGYLYGSSGYRMGDGYRWAWRDGQPWHWSDGWCYPAGTNLYLDETRRRLYDESLGELRVFDATTMDLLMRLPSPVEGDLAGYDPQTDQLYFIAGGQLRPWPASAIQPPTFESLASASPPDAPLRRSLLSPGWPQDSTMLGLWDHDAVSGNCYVFGAMGRPLYISSDGGDAWGQPQGLSQHFATLALSPDFARDRTLLGGIVGLGLFKSTDGGRSWHPSGAGLPSAFVPQVFLSPGFAHDRTAFVRAGRQGTLYRSTDGGETWQTLGIDLRQVTLSPEFDQDQTLMGLAGEQVLLSRDGGDNWEQMGAAPGGVGFSMLSLAPQFNTWQVAFAYDYDTLYHSVDGGRSWNAVLSPGPEAIGSSPQLVYGPATEKGRVLFLLVTTSDPDVDPPVEQSRLYYSEDAINWQAVEPPAGVTPTALTLSPDFERDGLLFVGTAGGRVVALEVATLIGP